MLGFRFLRFWYLYSLFSGVCICSELFYSIGVKAIFSGFIFDGFFQGFGGVSSLLAGGGRGGRRNACIDEGTVSIVMQWGGCAVIGNWRVDWEGFPERMHGYGLIVVGWGVDWMRLPAGGESWLGLNIPVGLVSARESVCEGLVLVERRAW